MNPEIDYQAHKLKIKHELQSASSARRYKDSSQTQNEADENQRKPLGVAMMAVIKSVVSLVR